MAPHTETEWEHLDPRGSFRESHRQIAKCRGHLQNLSCLEVFQPPFGRGEVVVDGQIVWRREFASTQGQASPSGVGVQFTGMAPADRAAFEVGYDLLLKEHEAVNHKCPAADQDDEIDDRRRAINPRATVDERPLKQLRRSRNSASVPAATAN